MKLEEDYQTIFDKDPDPNIPLFYTDLWTAINAIELAVTDADLIETAEAACSGEPEWPSGPCHFTPDEELVLPWGAGTNLRNQTHPRINTRIRRCSC